MSINLWKIALPQSRAFSLIITKAMRLFYAGLSYPQYYRDLFDTTYKQLDPQATDNLVRWEDQFYLPSSGLTEQQRRDRLEATWKMTGGQSPAYLQSILRGYGFDVYVHDWWMPDENTIDINMGGTESFMGADGVFMGGAVTDYPSPWSPVDLLVTPYYPLVNRTSVTSYAPVNMGSDSAFMNGEDSFMGTLIKTESGDFYPIPANPVKWRGFVYVAGETMPNQATVPLERKAEFEELILSIFPADKWVGVIVEYV
ncbi:hypothetical protein NVP1246O_30 [Vibrio phage 1.246.O._10N.261.54.E10]|nr:hypothetical protein NVP1246O_30 [Vibrio phage 1.246.O._10N.261.54.E10]